MTDASTPLLPRSSTDDLLDEPQAGTDDIERRLEEGLNSEDPVDFEDLLRLKPDYVISYLADKGTRKLGTFITEDTEVLPLVKDPAKIWTFGADGVSIDHEAVWKEYLANDNFKAKGFPSKVEVEAHVVALRNATLPGDRGVLNPLLEKWQDGALSTRVFGLPVVHAVIEFKWDKWARRVLLCEFFFYLIWLIAFQVFIIAFQDEDLNLSFTELWHTPRGIVTVTSSIVALIGMTPFLYIEACTLAQYGPQRWLSVWNVLDILTYVFQILISIAYFGRWHLKSDALSILSALQVLLLWWRVQYFARAFQNMRNTFLNTIVAVIRDVWPFLLLLLITLWGFAGAFYILFRDEQGTTKFDNPWHALTSVFTLMMGDIDVDIFFGSKKPIIGVILLVVFLFVMAMVLLNLLIAVMSDSATKASDDDGTKFLCSKAELIDELESSLPSWLRADDWYPAHIHILRVNAKSRDSVQQGKLWAAEEAAKDDTDGDDASEELQQSVSGMRSEIAELKSLLQRALGGGSEAGSNGGRQGIIGSAISSAAGYMPHIPGVNPSK
jgi:hypothetical protein